MKSGFATCSQVAVTQACLQHSVAATLIGRDLVSHSDWNGDAERRDEGRDGREGQKEEIERLQVQLSATCVSIVNALTSIVMLPFFLCFECKSLWIWQKAGIGGSE